MITMTNKKINVGVFSDVYYPMIDGVVKVLENHVKYLKERVNFYLIVPSSPKDYKEKSIGEIKILRTKSLKVFFLDYEMPTPKLDRTLKPRLKEIDLDLVVVHSPFGIGKFGLKWAKKQNIPSIIYAHSLLKQDFKRAAKLNILTNIVLRAKMNVYKKATKVVAVGEGVKNVYLNEYKLKNDVVVINNATDFTLIKDQKYLSDLKQKHNLKDSSLVFLFVGRINKLKGIYLIADSLKIVKDYGIDFKMIMVGDGLDLKPFQEHSDKLGLTDNMIYTGIIKDKKEVAAYFNISDLFLFPSFYDTNSLVQYEAASQKTPTLFVSGSTTSFGLKDGVQCFMTEHDVNKYANKIIELANNREKIKQMSEIVYTDLYRTWENSANQLYDLMIELINKK